MPRAARVHPDALLVDFREAGVLLGVDTARVTKLVMEGHLAAHPVLAGRIARADIERFCAYSDDNGDKGNQPAGSI